MTKTQAAVLCFVRTCCLRDAAMKAAAATDTTLTDRFTDGRPHVEIAGPRGWFLPQVDALLPKPIPTSLAIGP